MSLLKVENGEKYGSDGSPHCGGIEEHREEGGDFASLMDHDLNDYEDSVESFIKKDGKGGSTEYDNFYKDEVSVSASASSLYTFEGDSNGGGEEEEGGMTGLTTEPKVKMADPHGLQFKEIHDVNVALNLQSSEDRVDEVVIGSESVEDEGVVGSESVEDEGVVGSEGVEDEDSAMENVDDNVLNDDSVDSEVPIDNAGDSSINNLPGSDASKDAIEDSEKDDVCTEEVNVLIDTLKDISPEETETRTFLDDNYEKEESETKQQEPDGTDNESCTNISSMPDESCTNISKFIDGTNIVSESSQDTSEVLKDSDKEHKKTALPPESNEKMSESSSPLKTEAISQKLCEKSGDLIGLTSGDEDSEPADEHHSSHKCEGSKKTTSNTNESKKNGDSFEQVHTPMLDMDSILKESEKDMNEQKVKEHQDDESDYCFERNTVEAPEKEPTDVMQEDKLEMQDYESEESDGMGTKEAVSPLKTSGPMMNDKDLFESDDSDEMITDDIIQPEPTTDLHQVPVDDVEMQGSEGNDNRHEANAEEIYENDDSEIFKEMQDIKASGDLDIQEPSPKKITIKSKEETEPEDQIKRVINIKVYSRKSQLKAGEASKRETFAAKNISGVEESSKTNEAAVLRAKAKREQSLAHTVSNVFRVKRKLEEILETSKIEEDEAITELQNMKREKTQILNKLTSEMVRLKTLLNRDKDKDAEQ